MKRLARRQNAQVQDAVNDIIELEFIRTDGILDTLDRVLGALRKSFQASATQLFGLIRTYGTRTRNANNIKYDKPVFRNIGINDADVDIDIREWVQENVRLITNATEKQLKQIENLMISQYKSGVNRKEVKASVNKIFKGLRNNFDFIARDQINKLSGFIDMKKQTSLGIDGYYWRTVGDSKVRPEHAARNGKFFRWDSPPKGGHPKQDFNCRCEAEPALDRFFEDFKNTA